LDRRPIARGWVAAAALALAVLVAPATVRADAPAPPPGSWGAEMASVAAWLQQRGASPACTEHCFVLTRLHLTGAVDTAMAFTLEGTVVADKTIAVPLFGTPTNTRVDHVTDNGKPAAVGFEGDHWFVLTAPGRFVIEGTLALRDDMALQLPGPLDSLDADLTLGRVVEGAHLSGLQGVTVHFDRDTASGPTAEPPVFQLSRAVRIGRETMFEYRLVLRSGQDLGVVKLPLTHGEKVLDVQGATGWTAQGTELVLPTAGHVAQIEITGTLPATGRFLPDPRSTYEWWLVESDVEHRTSVTGDGRQVDASESPIARTQASARLFLVGRGQHLDVTAQALVATDALAAVVRQHSRTLVLTARGDLVADDVLTYENDGIDWLAWPPTGRAVFLGTDGHAERVMRAADGDSDVLVPLRVGTHTVHLQSMSTAPIQTFAGWLSVPTPAHALATSRTTLRLGLPGSVHPLVVVGGDHPWLAYGAIDAAAIAASIAIALVALRGRARRGLGAVSLAGLWLASPAAWGLLVGGGVFVLVAWAASRLLPQAPRLLPQAPRLLVWSAVAVVALVLGVTGAAWRSGPSPHAAAGAAPTTPVTTTVASNLQEDGRDTQNAKDKDAEADGRKRADLETTKTEVTLQQSAEAYAGMPADALGQVNSRRAVGGIVQGVAPVALPLPAYERSVVVTRELVTRDRPLSLRVVYVTTTGLAPLVAAWLACILLLVRLHAAPIGRLVRALRARLGRDPDATAETPLAPPPVTA
jgi:hypothetical protein